MWNKQALVNYFKDYKLLSLKNFTRAYLFQIALEIMWLPIQKLIKKIYNAGGGGGDLGCSF